MNTKINQPEPQGEHLPCYISEKHCLCRWGLLSVKASILMCVDQPFRCCLSVLCRVYASGFWAWRRTTGSTWRTTTGDTPSTRLRACSPCLSQDASRSAQPIAGSSWNPVAVQAKLFHDSFWDKFYVHTVRKPYVLVSSTDTDTKAVVDESLWMLLVFCVKNSAFTQLHKQCAPFWVCFVTSRSKLGFNY